MATRRGARITPHSVLKPRVRRGPTLIQRSRRVSSEEKAMYHQVLGAGRSRVKRPFFGTNHADEVALTGALGGLVEKRLRAAQR